MENASKQLADKLKSANNVLVTVSRDPSVDQLAAAIGLTLVLNKLDKHAAAVFSGQAPSTIEFLQPEETFEKNTDSLRDFIIALDKSKADKLRYKVEDDVVRIFITPYKTSISQDDLDFSQGDFNVDVVVALGVQRQEDLDEAVTAHGRILHDATVASINIGSEGDLGSINWREPKASSLSELVTQLTEQLGKDLLDTQTATALLTGIVAETDRFSNDKTSAETMSASAALMAAGANQQLVASKLAEPPAEAPMSNGSLDAGAEDGTLDIDHGAEPSSPSDVPQTDLELPVPEAETTPEEPFEEKSDLVIQPPSDSGPGLTGGPKIVTEPPALGGMLTANTQAEGLDPVTDPLSLPREEAPQLLEHQKPAEPPQIGEVKASQPATPLEAESPPAQEEVPAGAPATPVMNSAPPLVTPQLEPSPPAQDSLPVSVPDLTPPPAPPATGPAPLAPAPLPEPPAPPTEASPPAEPGQTLSDIEASVNSPHAEEGNPPLDEVRDEVSKALNATPATPQPIEALNAQPLGNDLHPDNTGTTIQPSTEAAPSLAEQIPGLTTPSDVPTDEAKQDDVAKDDSAPSVTDPTAPPPVPPPLPPSVYSPTDNQQK